jgi:flagellar hook-associated protein 2
MAAISELSTSYLSNINSYITQFVKNDKQTITNLSTQKTGIQNQISQLSNITTGLTNLLKRVQGFTSVGAAARLEVKSAVSSNTTVVTAEAAATAQAGVHTIFISQIASRDTALSDRFSKNDTSIATHFNGKTQRFTLWVGENAPVDITISFNDKDEKNSSVLTRIANAINNANAGVTASAIDVNKTTQRLSIVSQETGSANAITVANKPANSLLTYIGLTESNGDRVKATTTKGGFLSEDTADLDALFTLNGIEITQGSNTVADVVQGLTITLMKTQKTGDQPETITVTANSEQLKKEITGFIEDYNKVIDLFNKEMRINPTTKERGPLAGNFTLLQLKTNLRNIISRTVTGEENPNIKSITQLGITIDREGKLTIENNDTFTQQLTEKPAEIQALFNGTNGIAARLNTTLTEATSYTGLLAGIEKGFQTKIKSIDTRTKDLNNRIKTKEERLQNQYSQLQKVYLSLQAQQQMLQQYTELTSGGTYYSI